MGSHFPSRDMLTTPSWLHLAPPESPQKFTCEYSLLWWALMQNSDPPQCCHYNCIFANIWYLILLIQSFNIIFAHIYVFKQCVLADFWGRKDSAVGINKLFIVHSMCTGAVIHAPLHLRLAQIAPLFGSQNAIFVKHKYAWEFWLIMFRIRVCVRYPRPR